MITYGNFKDVLNCLAFGHIIKHIEQLSKETKEVTRYIEEALKLNELNKAKSNDSKNVINELGKEVEKLTLI
jgi:hypothetical protein